MVKFGQYGECANIVDQPGQHGLLGLQFIGIFGKNPGNGCHLQTVGPDFTEGVIQGIGCGLEDLFHCQADNQVSHQFDTHPGDCHLHIVDGVARPVEGAVGNLQQPCSHRRILGHDLCDLGGAGVLAFYSITYT